MSLQSPRMVRVLIVEDEPLARFVGRRSLEDLGFLVIEAETLLSRDRVDRDSPFRHRRH